MWEFPGGKVEGIESDLEALTRELREELALKVVSTAEPIAAFQDPGSAFFIVFIPVVTDGVPESREHAEIRWATWVDMQALPLAPTDSLFCETRQAERASASLRNPPRAPFSCGDRTS